MRIVHVIAQMEPGGAERVLLHLAEHGRALHELTVVSTGGAWVDRLESLGVEHVTMPGNDDGTPSLPGTIRTVRRVVRAVDPDVVHLTNIRVGVGASIGVRLSGRRPAVLTAAQGTAPEAMARAARVLRLTSPVVVGCAPSVSAALVAAGMPAERVRTIKNAAAFEPASPERVARLRADLGLGLDDDRPLVVGLGRLVDQKNWDVLIEAMVGFDAAEVVVAGDGPLRIDLEHRARAAGSPVRFVGHLDDVPALLATATCVVSTSDWEGLPLALLETMSLGVPIVATHVDGNPDHLGTGAVLVPRRDPDAVRTEVERMVTEVEHRTIIAAGALDVAASWSPASMVAAYHELYDELVR